MMKRILRVKLILVALTCFAGNTFGQNIETGFLDRNVTVKGVEYRYQVFVPREFTRSKTWPGIIALHGGGEYGNDGIRQTNGGLARAIRLHPERFPAIVLFPQSHADGTPGWQRQGGEAALAALDKAIKEFRVDPKRVVLTGYSAGGNGTWAIASKNPERFAAIVPICSFVGEHRGLTSKILYPALAPSGVEDIHVFVATSVAAIPIWIFHGDADKNVTVDESRKMAAALKALNAKVQYTELPGVEHNAWDPAYDRADLIEWMLKQRRP